ncbi:MAG: 3-dehydroquinate synthase [Myxococcales bacterium]|nr:3-dehydroquinate synthase [Polyangiaceae bacterium]MDW8249892.1 3-dehydroquinate synthase [Myxococcales bacterium]
MVPPGNPLARPVYLTGFMGTGKSTVGPVLAAHLGLPFVDADTAIASLAGTSLAELVRVHGEAHFRSLERRFLEEQLADPSPRVVALGGGALLDRSLRLQVLQQGTLLGLRASLSLLCRRLSTDASRPLLTGAPLESTIRGLLVLREDAYAEVHATLDVDHLSPEQAALRLAHLARQADLLVAAGKRSYPIRISRNVPSLSETLCSLSPTSTLLVTDRNVAHHYASSFPAWVDRFTWNTITLDPGESSKNEQTLGLLWRTLLRTGLDRRGLIVGIGGGVVTDLAGLAAGTWLRGIRWLAVPTTLLGMVDAAIGGKTAIDLEDGKNVVGLIHPPSAVLTGVGLLATEPQRGLVSGLAEAVKTALIGDASLLDLIEAQQEALLARNLEVLEGVVRGAARVKAAVVSRDEDEEGERRVLNLGHTLGHVLEVSGGFSRWTHGEAVALGMVAALRVGEAMGWTEPGLACRTEGILRGLGLPTVLDPGEVARALPLLSHDKKREQGEIHFVVVERPGAARTERITLDRLSAMFLRAAGA